MRKKSRKVVDRSVSWGDGSGDKFGFSGSVSGDVHTFVGSSDVNRGSVVRRRWVAGYTGEWPGGVLGSVGVRCSQEVGGIEGMRLVLGSSAGSSGALVFRSSLFVSGVSVEVSLGSSSSYYVVGDGVLGDCVYTLPYRTLYDGRSADGGLINEVEVRVCVGGVCGVGFVVQESDREFLTSGIAATRCVWYRVLSDGGREVVSEDVECRFPLEYGVGWSSDGVSCLYEVELSHYYVLGGDGVWVRFEDKFEELGVLDGSNAWLDFTGDSVEWVSAHPEVDVSSNVDWVGLIDGVWTTRFSVRSLWGFSTTAFVGAAFHGAASLWGRLFGSSAVDRRSLGYSYFQYTLGGKNYAVGFSYGANLSSDSGISYSIASSGYDSGMNLLVLDSGGDGSVCAPVGLGLVVSGRRVWSTGGVEELSGVVSADGFGVDSGELSDSGEYRVYNDGSGWFLDCLESAGGGINEYVGDMVYRGSVGVRFSVGGRVVARCGVLKRGCGISGLRHYGFGGSGGDVGGVSSVWVQVFDGSFDDSAASVSGLRFKVGGVWFPSVGGFIGGLDGSSGGVNKYYRYGCGVLDGMLLGLYGGGLLGGGYEGGSVLDGGWVNPRGFSGVKMDCVLVWGSRESVGVSVDCGGRVVGSGGGVLDHRAAASSWVIIAGAVVIGVWAR